MTCITHVIQLCACPFLRRHATQVIFASNLQEINNLQRLLSASVGAQEAAAAAAVAAAAAANCNLALAATKSPSQEPSPAPLVGSMAAWSDGPPAGQRPAQLPEDPATHRDQQVPNASQSYDPENSSSSGVGGAASSAPAGLELALPSWVNGAASVTLPQDPVRSHNRSGPGGPSLAEQVASTLRQGLQDQSMEKPWLLQPSSGAAAQRQDEGQAADAEQLLLEHRIREAKSRVSLCRHTEAAATAVLCIACERLKSC